VFLVFALFQFHYLAINSIPWHDSGVPMFFSIMAVQRDH